MKTSQGISQVYGLIVAAASVMALAIVLDAPRWILLAMVTLVAAVGLWLAWVASTRTGTALAPLRRAIRDLQSAAGTPPHHSGDGEGVAHLPERIDQASGAFTSTLARADRARAVLSAVIRGLPDPVLATDASGVVVEANPAAEAFVGTGSRRLAGREINEVLTWTDLLRLHDQGRAGTVRERVRLMRADGQRVLDVLVEPVPLDPRSPESIVLMVIHDVTDQARALQVKADFVANASHELRTPIAAMRVAIDTLEALEPEDHDARARFLRMVSANVERLEEMVRDLLDLSRLEAAEDEPELTTLALSQIVGSLAPSFEAICAERRLTLSWELDPTLEHLRTDRKLLLLVVQNLIDNATKFAYEGTTIRVVGRPVQPGRPAAAASPSAWLGMRLEVIDRGIGIPLAQQSRVFERFYQVDAARTGVGSTRRGTGLGLAIVKHAVKRLGGSIRVESVWKEGTRMIVDLPGCVGPEPTMAPPTPKGEVA